MNRNVGTLFLGLSLICLLAGLVLGTLAAGQFLAPQLFADSLPFHHTRPLHVFLAVSWIFLAALGGVYTYLPEILPKALRFPRLASLHFYLFLFSTTAVVYCLANGIFGGREYFNFPPILTLPLYVGWLLFAVNFFSSLSRPLNKLPVYIWMWATGILAFAYCVIETYLWMLPYFGDNVVRDMTVQWKSYGTLVGSWNMLIYGTAMYVMHRITGEREFPHSKKAFFLYFVGLTNLMFNWGHHTYPIPSAVWIKHVAYFISMTELIILYSILRDWRSNLSEAKKHAHSLPYRFLFAADVWVLFNLILAIAISVPAVNVFTHGTHITVAHAMGATIGINTMILLASISFIVSTMNYEALLRKQKVLTAGLYLSNGALVVFLTCLILAGIVRGRMVLSGEANTHQYVIDAITPYLVVFTAAGIGILCGLLLIAIPLLALLCQRGSPQTLSSTNFSEEPVESFRASA